MIKITPFVNPFRNHTKDNGDSVRIKTYKGKIYEQVTSKK